MINILKVLLLQNRFKQVVDDLDRYRVGDVFFKKISREKKELFVLNVNGFESKKQFIRACLRFKKDERLGFVLREVPDFNVIKRNFKLWVDKDYKNYLKELIINNDKIKKELDLNADVTDVDVLTLFELNYGKLDGIDEIKESINNINLLSFCYEKDEKTRQYLKEENECLIDMIDEEKLSSVIRYERSDFFKITGMRFVSSNKLSKLRDLFKAKEVYFESIEIATMEDINKLILKCCPTFLDTSNDSKIKKMLINEESCLRIKSLEEKVNNFILIDGFEENLINNEKVFLLNSLQSISIFLRAIGVTLLINFDLEKLSGIDDSKFNSLLANCYVSNNWKKV